MACRKLRAAAVILKKGKSDEFYSEISRTVQGYFADKLGLPAPSVTLQALEEKLGGEEAFIPALEEAKMLFDELSLGRFARVERSGEEMKKVYALAERVITLFEKAKRK